jgi:hypothetical protein
MNPKPSFHERCAEVSRIASMLEALAHDIGKAGAFLSDEAARMAAAEQKFSAKRAKPANK